MIPGLGSYAYRWAISHPELPDGHGMGLYEFIDEASLTGAGKVQICDNLPVDRMSEKELAEFKAYANERGIEFEIGMKGCQPDQVNEMIHLCSKLEVSILRIVLGPVRGSAGSVADYRRLLGEPVKLAAGEGVILAVENHFELSPFDLAELVAGFGSPSLQVCLDAVNSVKFLAGYKETFHALAPYAVSVHIKDVNLNRFGDLLPHTERHALSETTESEILENFGTGFYISGCPLGEGMVDLPWMINELKQYGQNPDLFVESWMDPMPTLQETLETEKHRVRHDFNELKKLIRE